LNTFSLTEVVFSVMMTASVVGTGVNPFDFIVCNILFVLYTAIRPAY
jgi:hypothetical protein